MKCVRELSQLRVRYIVEFTKMTTRVHIGLQTFALLIEFKNILEPTSGRVRCVGGRGSFSPNSHLVQELPKCFRRGNMWALLVCHTRSSLRSTRNSILNFNDRLCGLIIRRPVFDTLFRLVLHPPKKVRFCIVNRIEVLCRSGRIFPDLIAVEVS